MVRRHGGDGMLCDGSAGIASVVAQIEQAKFEVGGEQLPELAITADGEAVSMAQKQARTARSREPMQDEGRAVLARYFNGFHKLKHPACILGVIAGSLSPAQRRFHYREQFSENLNVRKVRVPCPKSGRPIVNFENNESALRLAIARGEIVAFYQPQVSAKSGEIHGVECLARWKRPNGEIVAPADFLPPVQDNRELIHLLGETMLRCACRDAAAWPGLMIGVNISPIQFHMPDLAGRIAAIAAEEKMSLERLELEILETSYFEDPAHMRDVLAELRKLGVKVALDDFGTGYSSLSALLELPLDKLKIDASFVKHFDTVRSASIIHAIVALARAIGLKITAEGVETDEQQRFLRAAGCHYLQGYLFSPAVPAEEITRMLAQRRTRPASA